MEDEQCNIRNRSPDTLFFRSDGGFWVGYRGIVPSADGVECLEGRGTIACVPEQVHELCWRKENEQRTLVGMKYIVRLTVMTLLGSIDRINELIPSPKSTPLLKCASMLSSRAPSPFSVAAASANLINSLIFLYARFALRILSASFTNANQSPEYMMPRMALVRMDSW